MVNSHQKATALASARAFLNKTPSFELIVEMCDLKPRGTWKVWEDDGGNFLRLQKDRSCHIYPSYEIEIGTKDIYRKARPEYIAKASYWALLAFGRESVVWFLGNDGKLRMSCFKDGAWVENRLPLLSGVQTLRLISERMTDSKLQKVELNQYDCAYITGWPPESNIECPSAGSVLKECGIHVG